MERVPQLTRFISTPLSPLPLLSPSLSLLLLFLVGSGTCCPFFWVVTTWLVSLQSPDLLVIATELHGHHGFLPDYLVLATQMIVAHEAGSDFQIKSFQ